MKICAACGHENSDEVANGIVATRVIADVHLIPGLWKIDGYSKLKSFVTKTFDVKLGENLFEFPYDWRRDNRSPVLQGFLELLRKNTLC